MIMPHHIPEQTGAYSRPAGKEPSQGSEGPPLGPDKPWLAPLAGFSDLPFRLLCREMGAAAACTEMISAKGLIYGLRAKKADSTTEELLATSPDDAPLIVQLFGESADFVGAAGAELRGRGFSYFDLNMGCSVPKVCKSGAGAALLKKPAVALGVAKALFSAAGPGRAGCKLRLGWDASSEVHVELGKALEDAGAAWLTLHPRYARQGFSGRADYRAFEKLSRAVSIPVLASGDLFRAEDGARCLESGAGGLMFARGAMANPAVFREYLDFQRHGRIPAPPSAAELQNIILRHARLARAHSPGRPGRAGLSPALLKMRTVAPRYTRHLPGAKRLRLALTRCASWEEFDHIMNDFFKE